MEAYAVFVNATEANMGYDMHVSSSSDAILRYLQNIESNICNDQDPEITAKQCHSVMPALTSQKEHGHLICPQIPYTILKKQMQGDVIYVMTFTGSDREKELVCFTDDLDEIYKQARYYTHEYILHTDMEDEISEWVWEGEQAFTWISYAPMYGCLEILRVGL